MSAVIWETQQIFNQSTHYEQWIHLHCFIGDMARYNTCIEMFPNSIFRITGKLIRMFGYGGVDRYMDLGRFVLETLTNAD